jgi:hypothetical protein
VLLTKVHSGYQIKKNWMGGKCVTYERERRRRNLRERGHL